MWVWFTLIWRGESRCNFFFLRYSCRISWGACGARKVSLPLFSSVTTNFSLWRRRARVASCFGICIEGMSLLTFSCGEVDYDLTVVFSRPVVVFFKEGDCWVGVAKFMFPSLSLLVSVSSTMAHCMVTKGLVFLFSFFFLTFSLVVFRGLLLHPECLG